MADNVTVDNGSLTDYTAATDKVTYSGDADVDVQLVRIVQVTGSEGSKTVVDLPGDATNGVDVDVTRIVPGTGATNLGKAEDSGHTTGDVGVMALGVRNDADASFGADLDYTPLSVDSGGNQNVKTRAPLVRVSVQSAGLTTATTNYTAGDQVGTQFTIAGAARASGGTGYIVGVLLVSAADVGGPYDVVFTRASVTLAADNAAYAISDADALNVVGLVQLAGAYDIGNNRLAQAYNLRIPYDCSGGTSLYAGIITRSGGFFYGATSDLQLIVFMELS
jgi:hypothetical protein